MNTPKTPAAGQDPKAQDDKAEASTPTETGAVRPTVIEGGGGAVRFGAGRRAGGAVGQGGSRPAVASRLHLAGPVSEAEPGKAAEPGAGAGAGAARKAAEGNQGRGLRGQAGGGQGLRAGQGARRATGQANAAKVVSAPDAAADGQGPKAKVMSEKAAEAQALRRAAAQAEQQRRAEAMAARRATREEAEAEAAKVATPEAAPDLPPADQAAVPQTTPSDPAPEAPAVIAASLAPAATSVASKPAPAPSLAKPTPAQTRAAAGKRPQPKVAAKKPEAEAVFAQKVSPPVALSRPRGRHLAIVLSFALCVLLPAIVTGTYLWGWAKDQYASYVAFSVRNEKASSALEILGGMTQLSGSSSSDTDILYEFIQSQELVAKVDRDIDLRKIWSQPGYDADPVFVYDAPGTIEDLLDYWGRMVNISYDASSGLIELRVLAFAPEDAKQIGERIYAESTDMINKLSDIAREDAIRYARDDLDKALALLKVARASITAFRNSYQIVDPTLDIADQMGLLSTLQQQLGAALVEQDILRETSRKDDPRITQIERRIRVIENRIEEERRKVGIGTGAAQGEVFANLVGEYERLSVDLQFAEQSFTAAQAAFNASQAEAKRQSRYLAAHISPTLAEQSQYPQRLTILALVTLFAFLLWAVLVLIAYSIKDRR